MKFLQNIAQKWHAFLEKFQPATEVVSDSLYNAGSVMNKIWKFFYRLRKIFLAAPVAWIAVRLALDNLIKLPKVVGITLQIDGEFSMLLARELAVLGPLAVTAFCLLLMFVSRRILTPWFVSLVSLTLPILLRIINQFPN